MCKLGPVAELIHKEDVLWIILPLLAPVRKLKSTFYQWKNVLCAFVFFLNANSEVMMLTTILKSQDYYFIRLGENKQ